MTATRRPPAHVLLARWMTANRTGPSALARLIGTSHAQASRWRDGYHRPSHIWRMAVERATGIPADAWDSPAEMARARAAL